MSRMQFMVVGFVCAWACAFPSIVHGDEARTPSRTWTDATGKFKIEAQLIDQNETHVRLLKADDRAVTVPIKILSDDDKKYLKDLTSKDANPFAGGSPLGSGGDVALGASSAESLKADPSLLQPNANVSELPKDGEALFIAVDNELPALEPDPSESPSPKFSPGAWPLGALDAYVRVSNPVVVDPSRGIYAVSTNRTSNAVADNPFGRIHLFGPALRKTQVALDVTPTVRLMDHHVGADRSLAVIGVGSGTERGGDLVLLAGLKSGKPKPLVRWLLPDHDKPGFKPKVEFARVISATQAVVQVNSSIYLWDLADGKCIWVIDQIRSGSKITVSPGGRYLAIPDGGGVRIVDILGAEMLGHIAFPSTLTPETHFSADGDQIALVGGNQYLVWDLSKGYVSNEMTIGTSSGKFYGWIGSDYLLTQHGGLVDPRLRLAIWSYALPSSGISLTMPGGVMVVDKDYKMSAAYAMQVPHAPVQAAARKLAGGDEKLMAVRPGTRVALKVDAPSNIDQDVMLAGLTSAVEKAGWKVAESSDIVVTAKIQQGESEDYHFRSMGVPRLNRPSKTVSIRPYKASLRITQGGTELWTVRSSKMVPFIVHLDRGQTIEAKMKEYEKPDPGYFERVNLPSRILKADISKNVGRSRIKNGRWQ